MKRLYLALPVLFIGLATLTFSSPSEAKVSVSINFQQPHYVQIAPARPYVTCYTQSSVTRHGRTIRRNHQRICERQVMTRTAWIEEAPYYHRRGYYSFRY